MSYLFVEGGSGFLGLESNVTVWAGSGVALYVCCCSFFFFWGGGEYNETAEWKGEVRTLTRSETFAAGGAAGRQASGHRAGGGGGPARPPGSHPQGVLLQLSPRPAMGWAGFGRAASGGGLARPGDTAEAAPDQLAC